MRRRYGVVISAAVLALQLAGNAGAQVAAPDLEELETIAELLDANDVEGLRTYLMLNPDLLQGESELAVLLREYMEQSTDIAAFLSVPEDTTAGAVSDLDAASPAVTGEAAADAGVGVASLY